MKFVMYVICLLAVMFLSSSCMMNRKTMPLSRVTDHTDRVIVVESGDKPGHFFVIVKTQRDLNDTLKNLQCRNQPCMVGRVGEAYVIERPEVD